MSQIPWDRILEAGPLGGALLGLVALLARIVVWRLRVRDIRDWNAALSSAANEETRDLIRSNPPPEPSSDLTKIGIVLLLLSGASIGLPLARDSLVAVDGNTERCERHSDCGQGCNCVSHQCKCAAIDRSKKPKRPEPQRGPQSSMAALPLRRFAGEPLWVL